MDVELVRVDKASWGETMYKEHPEFTTPNEETTIWRYLDFTKFMAMLEDKALFFASGDNFSDRFEGAVPKKVAEDRHELWEAMQEVDGETPESRAEANAEFQKLGLLARRFVAMNCWHMNEYESDALWKLYLKGGGEGVAIRSNVGRLKSAITDRRDVHIGEVKYIDYEEDSFETRSSFSMFLHKRQSFAHEHELRAMTTILSKMQAGEEFDYANRDPVEPGGVRVSVDLDTLVEQIVIAPGATWLELHTLKIVDRYGLRPNVKCTKLDADPIF